MPIKTSNQEMGARPLTPIFFLIDTSGSMVNDPIEAVNAAMREAIPEIKNLPTGLLQLTFTKLAEYVQERIMEDLA